MGGLDGPNPLTTSNLLRYDPPAPTTANAAGQAAMDIQGTTATVGENGPPEPPRPSMAKTILNGLACIVKSPLSLFNGAVALMRGPQTERPLEMGRTQSVVETYIDDAALDEADFLGNLRTLDRLTKDGDELSEGPKELMAKSPTLMGHLEDFEKSGWTLELGAGENFDDMPLRTRFHDADRVMFLSSDKMREDPEAFVEEFVSLMMINKEHTVGARFGGGITETNMKVELPKINAEFAAHLSEANAA